MSDQNWSLLVGVTDFDEGADLSTHLISYGWNVDHCYSAEAVMDSLMEGEYGLVILDEEILAESEWTMEEIADSLPADTRAIIIGDPGTVYPVETFGDKVRVLIRPFSYSLLHSLVEMLFSDAQLAGLPEEEEGGPTGEERGWGMSYEEIAEFVTV